MSFPTFNGQASTLFVGSPQPSTFTTFGQQSNIVQNNNSVKDIEVATPTSESIAALALNPPSIPQNYLIAGGLENQVRCVEIQPVAGNIIMVS